ncbi:MAG: hypothetical protein NT040_12385 [Bacteroidetes bacterium]|nr:hypothetical protein [Bacteroidota bacterium]
MSKIAHILYIFVLSAIVLFVFITISYIGYSYYSLGIEDRFFHPGHLNLKPSGVWGHGFGIIGSLLMIIGVAFYMARKRFRVFNRVGILKHWLEFHIFLCSLGPILVLFHTSFKFGGLVAISFWSMVAVFVSGIIGRFIYIQIPRTIEGRELSLNEVRELKSGIGDNIQKLVSLDAESYNVIVESTKKKVELYHKNFLVRYIRKYSDDRRTLLNVKKVLRRNKITKPQQKQVLDLVKSDISLNRRIERLVIMQNLFKYWHVAHLPFALVMLIIMIIHVTVTIVFGYRWIF